MMTFVAKDADLAGLIAKLVSTRNNQMQKSFCGRYLQYKREYHSSMVDQVIKTHPTHPILSPILLHFDVPISQILKSAAFIRFY